MRTQRSIKLARLASAHPETDKDTKSMSSAQCTKSVDIQSLTTTQMSYATGPQQAGRELGV